MAKGDVFVDTDIEQGSGSGQNVNGDDTNKSTPIMLDDDIEIIPWTPPPAINNDDNDKGDKGDGDKDDKGSGNGDNNDDEPEDKNKGKGNGQDSPGDSSSSPYLTFAKVLSEGGVFAQDIDDDEFNELVEETGSEIEALIELNRRTIADVFQAKINSLPPDYKALFNAASKGLPLREAFQFKSNKDRYNSIDSDDIKDDDDLAKNIVTEALALRGFSKEEIEDTIQSYVDTDKLTSIAEKSLKSLKTLNERAESERLAEIEQNKRNQEAQRIEDLKKIKSTITQIDKVLPGAKSNATQNEKMLTLLTAPAKNVNGQWLTGLWAKRAEDPVKFDSILAYMVVNGVFDGKMDNLKKQVKSEVSNEFANLINNSGIGTGSRKNNRDNPTVKELGKSASIFKISR